MYSVTTYLNVKQEENAKKWVGPSDEKSGLIAALQSIGHFRCKMCFGNVIGGIFRRAFPFKWEMSAFCFFVAAEPRS